MGDRYWQTTRSYPTSEETASSGFCWSAAGTYFCHASRCRCQATARRARSDPIHERVGEQHVDARLWQDPFAAVADELAQIAGAQAGELLTAATSDTKNIETYCRPPLGGDRVVQPFLMLRGVGLRHSVLPRTRKRGVAGAMRCWRRLNAEGFVPADSAAHRLLLARPASRRLRNRRPPGCAAVTAGFRSRSRRTASAPASQSADVAEIHSVRVVQAQARAAQSPKRSPARSVALVRRRCFGGPGDSRTEIHRVHAGGARSGCARVAAARGSIATIGQALVSLSSLVRRDSADSVKEFSARNSRPHSRQ